MFKRTPIEAYCEKKISTLQKNAVGIIDYVDISSVDNTKKKIISFQTMDAKDAPSRAKQLLKKHDIIVSTVRPNLNAVAVVESETDNLMVGSTGYCVLRCKDNIDFRYLFNFCQSQYFIDDMSSQATGASYPAVSAAIVRSSLIPRYPVDEQRKIASELDKVTDLINKRKEQLEKLDELVKARFVELFGDPVQNPMGWKTDYLKNATSKIGSGATPKGGKESYQDEGITLIRSMNVHDGRFEYKDLAHITDEQAKQLDNVTIEENDVFINITGASVARSCIVPKHILPARVNQHVAIIRCISSMLSPIFANNMFLNHSFKGQLLDIGETGGATRQAITKQQLETLEVILPPIEQQNQFAAFVEQTDKSKMEVQKSLEKLELLKKALMQKYFG